jgi:hypothetical protein
MHRPHIFPQTEHLLSPHLVCRMAANLLLGGWLMLFATVSRGKNLGTRLVPHRFKDNRYRVQLGKQGPYIPVTDYREIPSYLANGYSLQMSNKDENRTPTLISPQSIHGWTVNPTDLFFPVL